MRANTKKKHGMGKRFAIVVGVAAVGVMALGALALGAQTGAAGGAPDLKLSGQKKQSMGVGPNCTEAHRCGGPRAVAVIASCGEVSGPPVVFDPAIDATKKESRVPPANLPDLGCHVSAEGEVMGDKLGHGPNAETDLLGPRVQCEADPPSFAPHDCHWASGSRAQMWLKLREKTLKQVRQALTDGQKVRATVTVEARKAGKVATAKRTVRLVK
jgi:hypothetical protein